MLIAVVGSSLAACGSEESAAESVPALEQRLDHVDRAIESGDLSAAAEEVRLLIDEATRAREDGRLDDAVAADVIRAADHLLDELEASTEPEQPTETSGTDLPEEDGDQGPDGGKEDKDGEKPDKDDEGGKDGEQGEGGGGDD